MQSVAELRDRWRGEAQSLAREVLTRLVLGTSLSGLGLEEVDGRVDLRGLWVVSTKGLPGLPVNDLLATTPTASSVEWRDLDLSYSTTRIDLLDAGVENVHFARTGWRDWRPTACRFIDCSFLGADMRDSNFDGYNSGLQDTPQSHRPSTYLRCDFSRARIGPYGGFGRATLEDCLFRDTKFPSPMWFRGANIKGATFAGNYRTVCFGWTGPASEEAPWLDADLTQAHFESLEVHSHTGPGIT